MNRPQYEIADIIRLFAKQFTTKHNPNSYHMRVLDALSQCRTSSLGGHADACDCCGQIRVSYNSCRNRHCPKCQSSRQTFWVEDLLGSTLEIKHYHIVFTVPHELNDLCLCDSNLFYGKLFSSVWDTLRTFGYTRFGVESGAVCVLHTWGQNLSLHPHVHCIVPAVGLSLAGNWKFIGHGGKFLYPVVQLSVHFRSHFMKCLKAWLFNKKMLPQYQALLDKAWAKPWVVFCEPSLAKPEHVVKYLGQYTHRVAISNSRILNITNKKVTFLYKDYAQNAIQKPITLDGVEFLRRFCLHILPRRFVKIRRYGIYSSRYKALHQKPAPKPSKNHRNNGCLGSPVSMFTCVRFVKRAICIRLKNSLRFVPLHLFMQLSVIPIDNQTRNNPASEGMGLYCLLRTNLSIVRPFKFQNRTLLLFILCQY